MEIKKPTYSGFNYYFIYSYFRLSPLLKARIHIENTLRKTFFVAALVAILTTIGIISALLFQAVIFFSEYPIQDFFFGTHWSPMVALREGASEKFADEDVAGSTGSFGMIPVILGTLLVAFLAMCVAIPIGLFSAIYMAEFSSDKIRNIINGGRYDQLISDLGSTTQVSAVGAALNLNY